MEQEFVKVTLVGFGPQKKHAALDWCKERFCAGSYDSGFNGTEIYFNNEEDATAFVLRWS